MHPRIKIIGHPTVDISNIFCRVDPLGNLTVLSLTCCCEHTVGLFLSHKFRRNFACPFRALPDRILTVSFAFAIENPSSFKSSL